MKLFPLLTIGLIVVVASVSAMNKNDMKDMFRNMAQDCKEQEKASDDDVETMVDEKYPESKEGRCMMACK